MVCADNNVAVNVCMPLYVCKYVHICMLVCFYACLQAHVCLHARANVWILQTIQIRGRRHTY